jgi:hypothetical protein
VVTALHAARGPIEKKVTAATVGTFLSTVVVAVLNASVGNDALLGSLPAWLQPFVIVVGPSLVTFVSGYSAKHTPRSAENTTFHGM